MLSCPFLIIYLTLPAQSLLEILDSNLTRAQRDNDLIYHQDVPSVSSLPAIQPASMVSSIVPPGLLEPRKTLGNNNLIFEELIGLGAQTAIGRRIPIVFSLFNHFRRNL
jgi:programmed cell death 6-interacting protein